MTTCRIHYVINCSAPVGFSDFRLFISVPYIVQNLCSNLIIACDFHPKIIIIDTIHAGAVGVVYFRNNTMLHFAVPRFFLRPLSRQTYQREGLLGCWTYGMQTRMKCTCGLHIKMSSLWGANYRQTKYGVNTIQNSCGLQVPVLSMNRYYTYIDVTGNLLVEDCGSPVPPKEGG
jgi:hypothetical protein